MLLDWLHYLITPAPWRARRLGFVRDSIWLHSRSRRCHAAWKPHLEQSRALIAEAVAGMTRRRTVIVLGSGLLDDVPLDLLARSFEAVILVDMVHPWPARRAARNHRHIRLVTYDLSGCSDWMLGRHEALRPALPELCHRPEIDLVISANVLSQLPILPLDRLGSVSGAPQNLGARIVRAHLDGLAGLHCRICLLTDTMQREEDSSGRTRDRSDLLHGVAVGTPDREWDWELAPFGETGQDIRLMHRVHGFADWRPRA